ncbi:MAG: hypothetical protein AAF492_33400, partial [Verrucomicrobiota bacterium]
IVVIGGGESAADIANRLAEPELGNEVYLSLKTGIRVSPRYHPIRGVPSDFLRNRFMLSIHENIRNAVGQKFVEARIRHQERFERFFRAGRDHSGLVESVQERKRYWTATLTEKAKDRLFNMFHNKSDGFLDAVGEERIRIVGPPVDETYRTFHDFEMNERLEIKPDLLMPMIGYASNLAELSDGLIRVRDFYLGCVHVDHDDLFLVGFARPIIGNIPTISEMQAQYVAGLISGKIPRDTELPKQHVCERKILEEKYAELNTDAMYPVEMFPYCDRLAQRMGSYPRLSRVGSFLTWLKINLAPASTLYYRDGNYDPTLDSRG